ncbi:MAG: glutamate racemase [Bacteroidales bacterium]|nr:glutamate racemase [Bacteroidales bacterium]
MIGVFDSGVGGLSVFKELRKALPRERYVYFCDNAHCPYGTKSQQYIIDRAEAITKFLMDKGCNIIVVACNTATAAAIAHLRSHYPDFPFVGIEPAVKLAAAVTSKKVIGTLATAGTLSGEKYALALNRLPADIKVVEHIGEGFVELVENGKFEGPEVEEVIKKSLNPLLEAGADVIVLGCTHYPFLSPAIEKIAGENVTVIDPAPAVARRTKDILPSSDGIYGFEYYASGSPATLEKLLETLE